MTSPALLSDEQVGHLRHIDNLSRQPKGDWRHMMGPLPMQEDFSSYRYQLGYTSLALALAHYHRLPAAPIRAADGTISVRVLDAISASADRVEPGTIGEMGWIAGWAAEMGDTETLAGLLKHADTYMNPQWENGGLLYPRQDATYDANGNFAAVIPTMSNSTFPYARLNVANGLRTLYENPWTAREISRPALRELSEHVDVRRAWFDDANRRLHLNVGPMHGLAETAATLTISPVWSLGEWTLLVDGVQAAHSGDGAVRSDDPNVSTTRTEDGLVVVLALAGNRDVELRWA